MKKAIYMTGKRVPEAIENLMNGCHAPSFREAIKEAKTGAEAIAKFEKLGCMYALTLITEDEQRAIITAELFGEKHRLVLWK